MRRVVGLCFHCLKMNSHQKLIVPSSGLGGKTMDVDRVRG